MNNTTGQTPGITATTSGAADLPEALRRSTAADGKTELFNLPGYPLMVRAVDFNRLHTESEMRRAALLDEMQKAALPAGQATAAQVDSVPKAQFDDPKVQAVYAILCDDADWPPKENPQQHWDGWIARRIVDALLADSVLEDAARLDWLESQSQVNIERVRYLGADTSIYEVTPFNSTDYNGETLRKAIDAARKQGEKQ